jgi:hypothetical protein
MSAIASTLETLESKEKLPPETMEKIRSALNREMESVEAKDHSYTTKLLACYLAGLVMTVARYALVLNRLSSAWITEVFGFNVGNTFQIDILRETGAYVVGFTFLPALGLLCSLLLLSRKDRMGLYIIYGALFSTILPFVVTAILSAFGYRSIQLS